MKSTPKTPAQWNRLDNAAKIFPPTSTKRDTKVIRFACELAEAVEPVALQEALNRTLESFPIYRSTLKRGLFWYYLEESDLRPVVEEEHEPLCHELYDQNIRRLLFEVTYFGNRINLEIYHSLADGTGALNFLRLLVYYYLLSGHPLDPPPPVPCEASHLQGADDSFERYYEKTRQKVRRTENPRAYHLKGPKVAENRIRLIEGRMRLQDIIDRAHDYGATLTSFVTAILICAISDVMSMRDKRRPVVVTLPVNLRKYFFSESSRNFFSVFEVSYDFSKQSGEFAAVVADVTANFKQELTVERMRLRMNQLAAIEHNVVARAVPRMLKDPVLWAANKAADRGITAAVSNIGRVNMPAELAGYIRRFDVFVSTERLQICMCSYQDELVVNFTSAFESSEVQKNFFRLLGGMGVAVTIVTPPADEG